MEDCQKNEKGDEQAEGEVCNLDLESGDEIRRGGSWRRRGSGSFSRGVSAAMIEEIESVKAAEAGDDGGRSLYVGDTETERQNISQDEKDTNNTIMAVNVPDDVLIFSYPFRWTADADGTSWSRSPISPLPSDMVSPLSDHPLIPPTSRPNVRNNAWESQQSQVNQEKLPCVLEYTFILGHLAIFGIIGVLIRYALQILFGPNIAKVTNDFTPLYIDLPSNMVGSFFMGWVGVVFKRDISLYSKFLAIGLSTGLMGSITTLTSWIQKVVNLTSKGQWMVGFIGLLLGMELAQISLLIGIETVKFLKQLISYVHGRRGRKWPCLICIPYLDKFQHRIFSLIMLMTFLGMLWGGSILLIILDFRSHHRSKLWWACAFGPAGVWTRWFMARLNGKGFGSKRHLKWLPIGTLLTNLIATALMATLSIINLVVKANNAKILIGGLELGFLGCMSTVSTFVAEVHALHQSSHPWRAYAYISFTLFPAFTLGTLIYSVPVWMRGYS